MKTKLLEELRQEDLRPKVMGLTFKGNEGYYNRYKNEIFPERVIKEKGKGEYYKEFERCINDFKEIQYNENFIFIFTNILEEDIYVGSRFNILRNIDKSEEIEVDVEIKSIIHEWFLLPYKCINKYHKGICLLEFKNGIPDIIKNMKVYNNDFDNDYENIVLLNRGVTND